jgi:hypothetical protein
VQTEHIVKNRILRQLSADELKSVQPWLTLMDLRPSAVLHQSGQPIERVYFPVSGMVSLACGHAIWRSHRNWHSWRRWVGRG